MLQWIRQAEAELLAQILISVEIPPSEQSGDEEEGASSFKASEGKLAH